MEPFGLMQLLQSLFSQNNAATQQNAEEKPPETGSATSAREDGQSQNGRTEKTAPNDGEDQSPSHDAIVGFMERHERRSRRIGKE